ncbi:hypothetical protein [Adhaeretor mobilis]|uniref:Uncharacterized protein n=1 Tax=Adhaeretor mobilis TaxID=1930276 RepID=A0A517MW49_9BACT|nr:hypothetical protein [Adhaeretor mobilis]QDS99103.1 hypothetical protein HG15A2_23930 [Adhaeretor mobilis]
MKKLASFSVFNNLVNRPLQNGLLSILLASFVTGCADEEGVPRYHIRGEITFKGEPVPKGSVRFRPDKSRGNNGPSGYALIEEGQYDTAKSNRGAIAGPHIVEIMGYDGKSAPEMELGAPLFRGYQAEIELPEESSEKDFEVPTGR